MRVAVDRQLLSSVMRECGFSAPENAVKAGLELLLRLKRQERIRAFRGRLAWDGDLERMRLD